MVRGARAFRRAAGLLGVACLGCASHPADAPRAVHGAAAGDVGATRATVWSRADRASTMRVRGWPRDRPDEVTARETTVTGETDYTGHVVLEGLAAGRAYDYSVTFEAGRGPWRRTSQPIRGGFRTAPAPDAPAPVRLVWGGDLAGQNVCRDASEGFPIFHALRAEEADLFVALGDMIYGDDTCEAAGHYGNAQVPGGFGPATDLEGYRAHWRYAREDPGLQALLGSTASVAIWDDHEVVNDFGPDHDTRDAAPYTPGASLMPIGMRAFLEYNPIPGASPLAGSAPRLHRALRWGRDLETFVLDTRQHRDPNAAPDTAETP